MSDNVRFYWQNLFDAATLTASSEDAEFPAENLQERHWTIPWRSTGCTSEWVKWDLGSALAIKALVIRGHNLTTGATVHIQASATDVWTSPAVDETITITSAMISAGLISVNWTTAKTYQWWRLTIVDASNPDGYIELGRLFCGSYDAPERQASAEYSWEQPVASTIKKSAKGQKWVTINPDYLVLLVKFNDFGTADLALYEAMRKALSGNYAFFFCDDPANLTTRTFYVSCTSGWKIEHQHGGICYSMDLTLEEEQG